MEQRLTDLTPLTAVETPVMTAAEERELFLDLCQFLRDYEHDGNDISNVNWKAMDLLADQFLGGEERL